MLNKLHMHDDNHHHQEDKKFCNILFCLQLKRLKSSLVNERQGMAAYKFFVCNLCRDMVLATLDLFYYQIVD